MFLYANNLNINTDQHCFELSELVFINGILVSHVVGSNICLWCAEMPKQTPVRGHLCEDPRVSTWQEFDCYSQIGPGFALDHCQGPKRGVFLGTVPEAMGRYCVLVHSVYLGIFCCTSHVCFNNYCDNDNDYDYDYYCCYWYYYTIIFMINIIFVQRFQLTLTAESFELQLWLLKAYILKQDQMRI